MEAAIEYKNESIQSRQKSLRASFQNLSHSEANVLEKLICLSPAEIRAILFRYFNKVCFSRTEDFPMERGQYTYTTDKFYTIYSTKCCHLKSLCLFKYVAITW